VNATLTPTEGDVEEFPLVADPIVDRQLPVQIADSPIPRLPDIVLPET
jgi:hypothetical protein